MLKRSFGVAVAAPDYDEKSGGTRAVFTLAETLAARGFQTVLVTPSGSAPDAFRVPVTRAWSLPPGHSNDIGVFPEMYGGNPIKSRHVVRFLLNRPGVINASYTHTYGGDDFFVHFDISHVPEGRQSQDLYTPLVDRRYYHRNGEATQRAGFVICTKRRPETPIAVPDWARPLNLVLPHRVRSHAELGDLYRSVRAFIAFERTTAIYEALCCGCPVLCIERGPFNQKTFQPRFEGAGMSWDMSEAGLASAQSTVGRFNDIYANIERGYPERVETVFLNILRDVAQRRAAG